MIRNVNGIVFDLDGTLLDTREVIARSLRDVLRLFGMNISLDEMRRKAHSSPYKVVNKNDVSISIGEFRKRYWRLYEKNIESSTAFWG